uniref:Uncharacterized protein n=1 Tax=Triticum urartu TaxID=4572 RepID=A0A8R7UUE1_TRIUA
MNATPMPRLPLVTPSSVVMPECLPRKGVKRAAT